MNTTQTTKISRQILMMLLTFMMLVTLFFVKDSVFAAETDGAVDDECYTMGGGYLSDSPDVEMYGAAYDEEVSLYAEGEKFQTQGFDGKTYTHDDKFKGTTVRRGIDVSKWQKDIDWKKVKASGVEYAFIRMAYRSAKEGKLGEDEYGVKNLIGAKEAGLKVGVYIFSEAITVQEAEEEADYILNLVDGRFLDLPIVFDYEDGYYVEANIKKEGRFIQANVSKELGTQMCNAFCNRVKSRGYTAMVYANVSTLTRRLIPEQIYNTNYIWVARYNDTVSTERWKYNGDYNFWQYSESLSIDGMQSSSVDGDFWYDDGLSMALNRTGLFYQGNDICYFKNGYLDSSFNGLAKCKDTWYYVKNGKVDYNYTGLARNEQGWWYVEKGVISFKYNGLCANKNGTWYVRGSKIDFDYTGLFNANNTSLNIDTGKSTTYKGWYGIVNGQVTNKEILLYHNKDWWYCHDGMVDFAANTLVKKDQDWWYVKGGKVDFGFTGIGRRNGDWYVKNGKVQFDADGVIQIPKCVQAGVSFEGWYCFEEGHVIYNKIMTKRNANGLWYIGKDGKVDFSVNGLVNIGGTWWYFNGGAVNEKYVGMIRYNGGDWYVKDGKIQFGTTSVVQAQKSEQEGVTFDGWYYVKDGMVVYNQITIEQNPYGWWYIGKDGKVNFEFNGLAQNRYGWWYLRGGKVDFDFTGAAANEVATWYIEKGKVRFDISGLVQTPSGWYFVEKGKIEQNRPTLAQNHMGWWYIDNNGKIDFGYTGLVPYGGSTWYVKNGKVDFGYNGEYAEGDKKYNIVGGKVK